MGIRKFEAKTQSEAKFETKSEAKTQFLCAPMGMI